MSVRLTETAVAAGIGAADAFVAAKVGGAAPGGIPWPVVVEGAALGAGLFGDKLGLGSDVTHPAFFAAAALLGSRLTRAAVSGKLLAGPKAWGGAGGDPTYALSSGSAGGDLLAPAGGVPARSVRLLAGRRAAGGVGGASIYPAMSESAGVAG